MQRMDPRHSLSQEFHTCTITAMLLRRKWMAIVLVGVILMFLTLIVKMHMTDSQTRTTNEEPPAVFLDPQRNLPAKSKLYDWDVQCTDRDVSDTKFLKSFYNNYNGTLPELAVLEKLSHEELAAVYHTFIENCQYLCRNIRRLGAVKDGGWDVCHEAQFVPRSPCLVYSFGINNDFSFDDAIIKEYGCMVHSFDPSMDTDSYERTELNHFHNLGLSSVDSVTPEGWKLSRMSTIKKELGHTQQRISILKMDIELWEWDVLPDIIDSGILKEVDSLLIEFHLNLIAPPLESGRSIYLRGVRILKQIFDLGFRIFYTHRNPSLVFSSKCKHIERANCHEVSFVRVKS